MATNVSRHLFQFFQLRPSSKREKICEEECMAMQKTLRGQGGSVEVR